MNIWKKIYRIEVEQPKKAGADPVFEIVRRNGGRVLRSMSSPVDDPNLNSRYGIEFIEFIKAANLEEELLNAIGKAYE